MKKDIPGIRFFVLCTLLVLICGSLSAQVQKTTISGTVYDVQGSAIIGATIKVQNQNTGTTSDVKGQYSLELPQPGTVVLEISYLGYEVQQKKIQVGSGQTAKLDFTLKESAYALDGITISGKTALRSVKEKAFNVQVVDALQLHNTTLDIGHALDRISGVRVRENGGVGSQMNVSLNGFRGKQVRFFIDGIPMDNFGSSFQLNNIPINLAQRIEVYKGVVPVGLGADALGGAVNIITRPQTQNSLEASYSYGSFNTHRFNIYALFTGENGFFAKINAFANYSDNNYKVEVDAADINTGAYYPKQNLERFHNTYHNESIIASVGVRDKWFADELALEWTAGQNYKEIQTGARIVSVFGGWHRRGNILMPAITYRKKNFILENLDFRLNGHYNLGSEQNIDTLHRRYNWFGQYKEYPNAGGERSYSTYKYGNNNGLVVANLNYKLNETHSVALSNTTNTFNRKGSDALDPNNEIYEQPRITLKNISGLGYQFSPGPWNSSLFIKNYYQQNKFAQSYNPSGNYGDVAYRNNTNDFNSVGYGVAVSRFFTENLQVKASFEKSYRMPETGELFGDLINLRGNTDLQPEQSFNYNLGASYWWTFRDHHNINFNTNVFYRDAMDFIRPRLDKNQTMQIMENLGSVINKGLEAEIRYHHLQNIRMGVNITYQDLRNNTRYEQGQTIQSAVYKDRIPNMPFLYGNADATYTFHDIWRKDHQLSIGYNGLYVHAFYLYWPSRGSDKLSIPSQISHDLNVTFTFANKMQWILECKNLLDKKRFDNFSLQKPGRSFSAKIKYTFY
ncbi:TonB-dependent receptor [Membranicola marinus]|uniref:TonB-dependent receptor n=1 Tax=Membranihabitans marinus TaxID=1227546 RepID=A0A953HL57_9BACT|nr:TonB-dependent receptor [Membranihabitans marinus]MBY5956513.1 TonB-dependent receptor [Membranihabitans marinus]